MRSPAIQIRHPLMPDHFQHSANVLAPYLHHFFRCVKRGGLKYMCPVEIRATYFMSVAANALEPQISAWGLSLLATCSARANAPSI